MKKQWIAEAAYLVVALVCIGICIQSGKGPGREAFGTSVTVTPEVSPTEIPQEMSEPTSAPVQDTIPDTVEPTTEPGGTGAQESSGDSGDAVNQATIGTPNEPKEIEETNPEDEFWMMPGAIEIVNENYEQYSNDKKAWWFRRNTGHKPSGSGEEFSIAEYSGYYLNKSVAEEDKVIYLTFDCGYENGFTPAILDTLAEKNVKAMFFVTKDFIVKNPAYVKRMKEEGHLVGNHTVRHLSSPDLTPEELAEELYEVARVMKEQSGYSLDPFFRPPMGEYSERTLKVTQDMGYTSVFWSIAYYDYDVNDQPGKEYVIDHFATYHHNGCVALLHNISESNTLALGNVIEDLNAAGYRFGTLTELQNKE